MEAASGSGRHPPHVATRKIYGLASAACPIPCKKRLKAPEWKQYHAPLNPGIGLAVGAGLVTTFVNTDAICCTLGCDVGQSGLLAVGAGLVTTFVNT